MGDFLKGLKVNYTASALMCVVIGLVLLIWPGTTTQIVCMLLGAVLLLYGAVQVILYLISREKNIVSHGMMLLGIVVAVIGIWILVKPEMIIMAVPVIVGILIAIHGLHNIVQSISLKKDGYEGWWIACLMGVLTAVLGGVLIYNPFKVVDMVVRFIGIFLVYDGLSDMWIISRLFKVKKEKDRIIDVEAVEVDGDEGR
ncbi:MAG: DUF308 domain-containing protein [Lachnospiraceae bacterium]|nr:DUF308 domain-containing protein [Lachnospiraceae bacterium]